MSVEISRGVVRGALVAWVAGLGSIACGPGASGWMAEPLVAPQDEWKNTPAFLKSQATEQAKPPARGAKTAPAAARSPVQFERISQRTDREVGVGPGAGAGQRFVASTPSDDVQQAGAAARRALPHGSEGGRVVGRFKNTYYDFPSERELSGGAPVGIFDASCTPVAQVSSEFFERMCVQGSGTLASGDTVSFAKRDCSCAATCPKTNQRLCFDRLDAATFPWGRGATGRPIAALRTLAVDPSVVPMGSLVYVPEFDGLSLPGGAEHDGCFIAQDRGMWVKGRHIDVFAGTPAMRLTLEKQVATGSGVTVILDSPRCRSAVASR